MTEHFGGLFEYLDRDQSDQQKAARKAIVLASRRVELRFGKLLENDPHRIALIQDDFNATVKEACDEVGHEDYERVAKAIKRSLGPDRPGDYVNQYDPGQEPGLGQPEVCPHCGQPLGDSQEEPYEDQAMTDWRSQGGLGTNEAKTAGPLGGLGFDEELPAGYQDADIEQREYEDQARQQENVCPHCGMPIIEEESFPTGIAPHNQGDFGQHQSKKPPWLEDAEKDAEEEEGKDVDDDDDDKKESGTDKPLKDKKEQEIEDEYFGKTARRPKLCPYHGEVVDIALATGEPGAGFNTMAQHAWGPHHCQGNDYEGRCNFKREMVSQSYWDDKAQQAQERRDQRELDRMPVNPDIGTPEQEMGDDLAEPVLEGDPSEGSDMEPTAVGMGEEGREMAMVASRRQAEALETVDLQQGGEGPSPKIDKRTWKPNALNPDGNLKPIDTEDSGSPHPTVDQDITEVADHKKDFLEQTKGQSETETLPSANDDGYSTEKNLSQDSQGGVYPKGNQADPVGGKMSKDDNFDPSDHFGHPDEDELSDEIKEEDKKKKKSYMGEDAEIERRQEMLDNNQGIGPGPQSEGLGHDPADVCPHCGAPLNFNGDEVPHQQGIHGSVVCPHCKQATSLPPAPGAPSTPGMGGAPQQAQNPEQQLCPHGNNPQQCSLCSPQQQGQSPTPQAQPPAPLASAQDVEKNPIRDILESNYDGFVPESVVTSATAPPDQPSLFVSQNDLEAGIKQAKKLGWGHGDEYGEAFGDDVDDPYADQGPQFANPGSALRAEGPNNPRNLACPTCGREGVLTPEDAARGYQCDYCADAAEGLGPQY